MDISVKFGDLEDSEKRELAGLMLEAAEQKGLAVALPERTKPYTVPEAQAELNVKSRTTVYNMIDADRLAVIPGLSVKMITAASLHAVRDGKESV